MATSNAHQIVFLLLVAAVVSMLARRVNLPASSGLLLAGLALAVLPLHVADIGLTRGILFTILLPALVFESAINLRASELRADWQLLLTFTTVGVGISLGMTAAAMHYIVGWPWHVALIFGAIISATDPIAVLATFKQSNLGGRPRLLAEAESLLNDGVAVVALGLVLLGGPQVSAASFALAAAENLGLTVLGGVGAGLITGWLMTALMSRSDDPLTETTLTFVGAYGSYYIADAVGASGILAAVASGLFMGNVGVLNQSYITQRGREIVESLWDFAAFIANAFAFLLMGINLEHVHLHRSVLTIIVGVVVSLGSRAFAVYICCAIFSRSRLRVPMPVQHLLVWGGQRGALSLVLALALRTVTPGYEIGATTAGVVAFSILVQGTTFAPLLKRLAGRPAGLGQAPDSKAAEAVVRI